MCFSGLSSAAALISLVVQSTNNTPTLLILPDCEDSRLTLTVLGCSVVTGRAERGRQAAANKSVFLIYAHLLVRLTETA